MNPLKRVIAVVFAVLLAWLAFVSMAGAQQRGGLTQALKALGK